MDSWVGDYNNISIRALKPDPYLKNLGGGLIKLLQWTSKMSPKFRWALKFPEEARIARGL
jgi:hypothetical protein